MKIPGAAGVGSGGNNWRQTGPDFGGYQPAQLGFLGSGAGSLGALYSAPYYFSGIPGVPAIPEIRQIPIISATSDLAPRNGSLVLGSRAPRGSDLRGCDWRQTGPDFGG